MSGLSPHVSNSSRGRRLGPRLESHSGLGYWSLSVFSVDLVCKEEQIAGCGVTYGQYNVKPSEHYQTHLNVFEYCNKERTPTYKQGQR